MSIKKLFDSNKPQAVLKSTNLEEEVVKNAPELESADNVREQIKRINRFVPQVDYTDPGNFAVYGSAQSYYEDSVNRIITKYPYDGSEEEITEYLNESNYLDLHILENEYPRTNGFIQTGNDDAGTVPAGTNFGQNDTKGHITFFGGPNTVTGGMTTGSFHLQFTGSNYYDTDIYQTDGTLALDRVGSRESNLTYNLPSKGVTVEFWTALAPLHDGSPSANAFDGADGDGHQECLFDLWNGEVSSSAQYGRLTLFASGANNNFEGIYLNAYSGTVGIQNLEVLTGSAFNYTDDSAGGNKFHHLAFAFSSGSSLGLTVKSYVNGALTQTTGSSIALNEVTGALRGRIAGLLTNPSGTAISTNMDGFGRPMSRAYDEFRYWKAERTEKEIQQNYWTQVRGGTNNEIANAELGVYFKFNEGITGDATTDATVLDYSGRITNGTTLNYGLEDSGTPGSAGSTVGIFRNTGSAINLATGQTEFKDPIIYASHPDVISTLDRLSTTGSMHDFENQASLMDSLPSWLVEEDETSGANNVKKLTQILGSYFDTLNLQIQSLPDLTDTTYVSASNKPIPFARNLLSSKGLSVPEIFVDADILERFANKSSTEEYSMDINEVKNLIYKNIYNNLTHIYKSKGTEKAFRNLMHCYGIGDNIVRFNAYSNNATFNIDETRQATSIRKNYVDFNHPDRFGGVVYQNSSSVAEGNATYFSASTSMNTFAETAEIEAIFPRKFEFANSQYFDTPFVTASVFGKHSADGNPANRDASFSAGVPWYNVYAVRTHQNSKDVYFVLDSPYLFTTPLTSSIYSNVYDNQKWNFAVKIKSKNWPYTTGSVVSGDASPKDCDVTFVGYNVENGVVRNEFSIATSSISHHLGPARNWRFFVGAQRTNFTSTVLKQTDILASSLRVYTTHLDDEVIKSHALDPENYGTRNPNRNFMFYNDSDDTDINPAIKFSIPESVALALNWDYSQVTTTDASGEFTVEDASSGSTGLASRYPQENVLRNVNKQFAGRAYFPSSTNSTNVISKQFVQSSQQRLPEVVNTDDNINVLSRDDELYPRDAAAYQMYYAFEKSMYGVVSQEMVNLFSSVVAFNDLIGEVVNKYRGEYKSMRLLRELFFEKIQDNPDLDKFIDYYKWIDASLSLFLQQLVPASADVSDEIRTMVEDHILTRSKYQHQYPHLDYKGNARFGGDEAKLEARAFGINELDYNWQFGHAPIMTKATGQLECLDTTGANYDGDTIVIVDGAGNSITYKYEGSSASPATGVLNADGTVAINVEGISGILGKAACAAQVLAAINSSSGHGSSGLGTITAVQAGVFINLTQNIEGESGNTTIVSSDTGDTDFTSFTGGTGGQSEHSIWWKERAERNTLIASSAPGGTSSTINSLREDLNDIILSFNSASVDNLNTAAAVSYAGSTYAVRRFATPVKLQTAIVPDIGGGYNYPRGHKPDALFPLMFDQPLDLTNNVEQVNFEKQGMFTLPEEELRPVIKQEKRRFTAINPETLVGTGGATVFRASSVLAGTKFVTPFIIFSSSVSPAGGYGQQWQTYQLKPDLNKEEMAGYHNDSYGDDYEVPMQGPFTNQHVGGNRHRHTDLNEGSDTALSRAEAWELDISESEVGAAKARGASGGSINIKMPGSNPNYRRDETAKRPVNIKNIKHRTGSLGTVAMGNFDKKYEIVSTTSRTANNAAFVKAEGTGSFTITVAGADEVGYIDHVTDYAKPTRRRTPHVIVSRFSAPGGPETAGDNQGGPGLDFEAAEFSPYNNLNYRNTTVRDPVRTLLSEHSAQFGLKSGSAVSALDYTTNITASFHKTNRNTLRRVVSGNYGGSNITGSLFDNYYVQHMIPRTDFQYTWITASISGSQPQALPGYLPYDGLVSSSSGLVSAINFVEKPEIVSKNSALPLDFIGLNTTRLEYITASAFYTGLPLGQYTVLDTTAYAAGVDGIGPPQAGKLLNAINSARTGPTGYSTQKQIRVGQSLLGRHLRKNNIYSHTPSSAEPITVDVEGGTTTVPVRFRDTISLERAPLDETQKPLLYKLVVDAGETNAGRKLINETILKSSFGNKLLYFDDTTFNEAIGVKTDFADPAYRTLLNIYGRKRKDDSTAPIQRLSLLEYTETIYPSKKNAYKSEIRGRNNYENNFWRDSREGRDEKGSRLKTLNVANKEVDQSAWSLDAPINMLTAPLASTWPYTAAGIDRQNFATRHPGELQNEFVHVHAATASQARPGALYARKQVYPATGAIVPRWGMEIFEVIGSTGDGYSDTALVPTASLFRGEAIWQAADDSGFYEGTSSVFTSASTNGNPFYDTYDKYFADIRSKGKSHSVVPEYRITDHLEFYKENDEDFLVENQKLFSIVGSPSGSTIPQNSAEDNFFSTFSTSDFLKYFEIIKKDHDGVVDPHSIKIKCKAIKKFNPYDGFYPAERTTQIANQFVNDFSGAVAAATGNVDNPAAILRNLMKPLFAPGILYNTIKSGVAVDYPILSSSPTNTTSPVAPERAKRGATYAPNSLSAIISGGVNLGDSYRDTSFAIFSSTHPSSSQAVSYTHDHFNGWDKRIPFEALLNPENHIANTRIGDDEPSPFARIDTVSTWDGTGGVRYKKMINNFLAESVSFFLKGGQVSKIESLPQDQFKSVIPGQPYGMRVKMWRSQSESRLQSGSWGQFELPQNVPVIIQDGENNPFTGEENSSGGPINVTPRETFTMYSRPAAFGPPLGLRRSGSYNDYPAAGDQWPGSVYDFSPSNGIYGSHTPPYYDGESWFDIIFWPRGLETQYRAQTPHLFKYQSGETGEAYKPTLEEIFAQPNEALFRVSGSAANTEATAFSNTQIPLAGSFTRKWRYDQESLKGISNSTYHVNSIDASFSGDIVALGPAAGPFMNEWAMHLDACLNIFNKDANPSLPDSSRKWSIQTKFETPMFNFNHVTSSDGTLTNTEDANSNAAIPRGMWHQFGRLPQNDDGVYMQVTDIPTNWLENHPSASLRPDLAGISSTQNKSPYVDSDAEAKTYYNQYSVPIGTTGSNTPQSFRIPKVQSLVDVCGFPTAPVRLGVTRSKRTLSEAIVAVPFRVVDGERKFYETFKVADPETVVSGRSYRKLVQAQRKYVFPPTFDFVNNTSVTPVAMYVFEFNHDFDTNDLSMIWQNVAPKIVTEAQSAYSTIEHELLANELLANIEETAKAQFFGTQMPYIDLDKEIQWMVFKVKQRASRDYFTKINRQLPEMPFYTDNWPYDYCSLVELAKLDAAIQFRKISPDRKVGYKKLTPAEAAAFAGRGEAGSGGSGGTIAQGQPADGFDFGDSDAGAFLPPPDYDPATSAGASAESEEQEETAAETAAALMEQVDAAAGPAGGSTSETTVADAEGGGTRVQGGLTTADGIIIQGGTGVPGTN